MRRTLRRIRKQKRKRNRNWILSDGNRILLEHDPDGDVSWLLPEPEPEPFVVDQTLAQADCPKCEQSAWIGAKCPICGGHGRIDLADI